MYKCSGHLKCNCPSNVDRSEAPGTSQRLESNNATVAAGDSSQDLLPNISDEQLEDIVTTRSCSKEQQLLEHSKGQAGLIALVAPGP